ncbi:hypothetical protein GMRT_15060 [Giardia muris]|uniref:Uncharacterized protein n=1 Tax=Giardia muris TaxID=5742 RepID=A0A4Z1SZ57_GIAMU|nr:hypothetical protein GMRT_15060 [Giardia muris]|eukprot:TNJ26933.1 hypothetical protein GMRT_15060 [Giardia muris]
MRVNEKVDPRAFVSLQSMTDLTERIGSVLGEVGGGGSGQINETASLLDSSESSLSRLVVNTSLSEGEPSSSLSRSQSATVPPQASLSPWVDDSVGSNSSWLTDKEKKETIPSSDDDSSESAETELSTILRKRSISGDELEQNRANTQNQVLDLRQGIDPLRQRRYLQNTMKTPTMSTLCDPSVLQSLVRTLVKE